MVKSRTLLDLGIFMKLILTLLLLLPSLYAGIINGIALTINEEAITLYEIDALSQQAKISQEQATMELIKKSITKIVAEEKNIIIEPSEIEARIKEIQEKNNFTDEQFEQQLSIQGLSKELLFEQFEYQQLQQRVIGMITYGKVSEPSIEDKKVFYELHKDEFAMPKSITITQYSSADKNALESILRSPLFSPANVVQEDRTVNPQETNPQLLKLLLATKKGNYTQILPLGPQTFGMFYIKKIGAKQTPSFKTLEKRLSQMIQEEKKNSIINNFFTDEIRKANINYLRVKAITEEI